METRPAAVPACIPACITAEVWKGVQALVAALSDEDLAEAVTAAERRTRQPSGSGIDWHGGLTLLLAGVAEQARRTDPSGSPEAHALAATCRATAAVTEAVTWLVR